MAEMATHFVTPRTRWCNTNLHLKSGGVTKVEQFWESVTKVEHKWNSSDQDLGNSKRGLAGGYLSISHP